MWRKSFTIVIVGAALCGCTGDQASQDNTLGTRAGAGGPPSSTAGAAKGRQGGALIGRKLAKLLDAKERKAVGAQTNRALDGTADGKTVTWRSPDTGAQAKLTPRDTKQVVRSIPILRKKEVAPPLSLELIGKTYIARKNSNLRAAPRASAAQVGRLRMGDRFQAIGKVTGETWIMVGRNNRSVGYVHAPLVGLAAPRKIDAPVPKGAAVLGGLPVTDRSLPFRKAVDLDAMKRSPSVDLDKEDLVAEPVEARQQCRTMQLRVEKQGKSVNDQFQACRAGDGAWERI